jgi:hypothetical protein
MSQISYKILAAQRLAIDPNALLSYFEFHDHALCTTPDGRQYKFSFAELIRPAKKTDNLVQPGSIPVAEKNNSGVSSAAASAQLNVSKTKKVAKPKPKK